MIRWTRWIESNPRIACNLAVLYAGAIFLVSSIHRLPKPPGPEYTSFILHLIEYLGFGFILLAAIRSKKVKNKPLLLAIIIAIFYALTDEIHQYFVPTRVASLTDLFADSVGSATGALIFEFLRKP